MVFLLILSFSKLVHLHWSEFAANRAFPRADDCGFPRRVSGGAGIRTNRASTPKSPADFFPLPGMVNSV
jgi:hypothetical protein